MQVGGRRPAAYPTPAAPDQKFRTKHGKAKSQATGHREEIGPGGVKYVCCGMVAKHMAQAGVEKYFKIQLNKVGDGAKGGGRGRGRGRGRGLQLGGGRGRGGGPAAGGGASYNWAVPPKAYTTRKGVKAAQTQVDNEKALGGKAAYEKYHIWAFGKNDQANKLTAALTTSDGGEGTAVEQAARLANWEPSKFEIQAYETAKTSSAEDWEGVETFLQLYRDHIRSKYKQSGWNYDPRAARQMVLKHIAHEKLRRLGQRPVEGFMVEKGAVEAAGGAAKSARASTGSPRATAASAMGGATADGGGGGLGVRGAGRNVEGSHVAGEIFKDHQAAEDRATAQAMTALQLVSDIEANQVLDAQGATADNIPVTVGGGRGWQAEQSSGSTPAAAGLSGRGFGLGALFGTETLGRRVDDLRRMWGGAGGRSSSDVIDVNRAVLDDEDATEDDVAAAARASQSQAGMYLARPTADDVDLGDDLEDGRQDGELELDGPRPDGTGGEDDMAQQHQTFQTYAEQQFRLFQEWEKIRNKGDQQAQQQYVADEDGGGGDGPGGHDAFSTPQSSPARLEPANEGALLLTDCASTATDLLLTASEDGNQQKCPKALQGHLLHMFKFAERVSRSITSVEHDCDRVLMETKNPECCHIYTYPKHPTDHVLCRLEDRKVIMVDAGHWTRRVGAPQATQLALALLARSHFNRGRSVSIAAHAQVSQMP